MLVLVDLAELAVSVILTDTTANIPRTSQITGFGGLGEKTLLRKSQECTT